MWARCQDALLSEKAVVIYCTTIWILKRKICLYVIEIFWKDTKGTVNSGMPLKKDTRDWRSGRGKEIYFSLYSFWCFLKKSFFFYYVHALSFRLKRKCGGGGLKTNKSPGFFWLLRLLFLPCLQPGPAVLTHRPLLSSMPTPPQASITTSHRYLKPISLPWNTNASNLERRVSFIAIREQTEFSWLWVAR